MPRTIKNPGVFAADAQTTIPPTPVVGIAYRNAATGSAAIRAGWPFKTIVDSSDFAQILHELTSLTDLIDKTGILEYKDDIDYDIVPAFAVGSDGELYKSTAINGPASTVVDPVGDLTGVWVPAIVGVQSVGLGGSAIAAGSNFDLNNASYGTFIETNGINSDAAANNWPDIGGSDSVVWIVETIGRNARASQIARQVLNSGASTPSIYHRLSYGTGVWSAWQKLGGGLGEGQSWSIPASRAIGVTYTNTTGSAIGVSAYCSATAASGSLFVDGVSVATVASNTFNTLFAIVPSGQTYILSGVSVLFNWAEFTL